MSQAGAESAAGPRARVDRSKCCGYALCVELCPEVYLLDDRGFACTDDRPIAPEHLDRARQAAEGCPERAIALDEGARRPETG